MSLEHGKTEPELFQRVDMTEAADRETRPNVTYWQDVRRRLFENKTALTALFAIIVIVLCAIVIPIVKPDYYSNHFEVSNQWPNASYWFGTDNLGRDIFTRIWFGARYSLIIAFAASFINLVIGTLYGGISGYAGGILDSVMMRLVDIIYSIPMTLYVILFMVFL